MSGRHKWPPPRRVRDLRDPQALGTRILRERKLLDPHAPLSQIIDALPLAGVPDYDGGGLMSNDPAKHHSKTKQDAYVESDGGE